MNNLNNFQQLPKITKYFSKVYYWIEYSENIIFILKSILFILLS